MERLLKRGAASAAEQRDLCDRVLLGLHHEQQHQELLLTDLKYAFGHNPLFPKYCEPIEPAAAAEPLAFVSYPGGIVQIGASETECLHVISCGAVMTTIDASPGRVARQCFT